MDLSRTPQRPPVRERRRLYRFAVDIAAVLSGSILPKRRDALLTDVSPLGCQVRVTGRFNPRDFLMVSVPSFSPFGVTVIWTEEGVFGVEFVQPLAAAVVQRMRQLRPEIECTIERRWRSSAE